MKIQLSPNYTPGRGSFAPEALVVHITDGSLKSGLSWVANAASQVSYHYIVGDDLEVYEIVKPENTAWHAGLVIKPAWKGIRAGVNPNKYTLGVAFAGSAALGPTFEQLLAGARLLRKLAGDFHIPIDREHIIGHHEIRWDKSCPGPRVPLDALVQILLAR